MRCLLLRRISFPLYDPIFLLDICYDLAKYRGIHILETDPAIKFFHHYQKLITDSRNSDTLDPYPVKHIGNLKVIVDAIAQMMKQQSQALNAILKRR